MVFSIIFIFFRRLLLVDIVAAASYTILAVLLSLTRGNWLGAKYEDVLICRVGVASIAVLLAVSVIVLPRKRIKKEKNKLR